MLAGAAMAFSSVSVMANSLRLRGHHPAPPPTGQTGRRADGQTGRSESGRRHSRGLHAVFAMRRRRISRLRRTPRFA
jgi:hypothetical protein